MATQVIGKMEVESTVFRLGDILPKSFWTPYGSAIPAFVKGSEHASDGSAGDGNSIAGAIVAIALEAAAALGVYGIWQLWHFLQ